jgi:hypothetical protein
MPITIMRIIIKVDTNGAETSKEFIAIARYKGRLLLMQKLLRGHEDLILTLLKMI